MTRTDRLLVFAAVLSAFASLGCGRGDAAKVTLTYHPPLGAIYHYSLDQYFDITFEGDPAKLPEQQMAMHVQFAQTVNGPMTGGIGVTMRLDSATLDSPLMAAKSYQSALDGVRGLTSAVVYDDRMNVVHAELVHAGTAPTPLAQQFDKNLKEASFPLPPGSVGIGDSWTVEIEAPLQQMTGGNTPFKAKTKLTVKEISPAGADTTVRVALETTFPSEPIKVLQQNQVMTLKLTGRLTGEQIFSTRRGAVLRSSRSGTMRINMQGGDAGAEGTTVTAKQSTTLELREAK